MGANLKVRNHLTCGNATQKKDECYKIEICFSHLAWRGFAGDYFFKQNGPGSQRVVTSFPSVS